MNGQRSTVNGQRSTVHGQRFHQGRHEEQGDEQGHGKVDDHHRGKVLQVEPDVVIEEEDDHQGSHGGERGSQYRHERLKVMTVHDMVCHDDGAVDHQIERDGDASQGIQLHFQAEEIIEDERHGDIHRQ